jgi:hypothetical protein
VNNDPIKSVALDFVNRINAGDADRLAELMTEDHEFIDMEGSSARGRGTMRDNWIAYYRLFPDYHMQIEQVLVRGTTVILIGRSTGTLSEHGRQVLAGPDGNPPPAEELQGPAIWTAEIRDRLVAQWCVLKDTPAVRSRLGIAS